MILPSLFFLSSLLLTNIVSAIYVEEAFISDWQLESIGPYECILGNADHELLIVLSDYDSKTLVSFVNETSGDLLFRQQLDFKAEDAMMANDGSQYVLKDSFGKFFAFDGSSGFPLQDNMTNYQFASTCTPDLSNVRMTENSLKVIDGESQLELFHADLPDSFRSIEFLKTDYIGTLRVLYSTTDAKYVFHSFVNGELQYEWYRDESINNITAHTFIDLPDAVLETISQELSAERKFSNIWEAYLFRAVSDWTRIKKLLKENHYSPGKILTKLMKFDSNISSDKLDVKFGLAKYLVVATSQGRIAALDLKNGNEVWKFDSGLQEILLLEWSAEEKEFLAFAKDGSYSFYSVNNASQPVLRETGSLYDGKINSLSQLNFNEYFVKFETGHKRIISLGNDASNSTVKTFVTDHDSNGVHGYITEEDGNLKNTWQITVEQDEEIVAFSGRESTSVVTLGHALGNRTVLYKYLYPNLASYAVLNVNTGYLYINLIDTVSGELLHTQFHDDKVDGGLPINILFGEYWFSYSYFSTEPIPEQKLVVVELYESLEANQRVSNSSANYNPLQGVHKPQILSKSYFFPEVIRRMAISATKFGITSKAIILELENGQITYISKDILSARRVAESEMTNDDKKQFMAIPYVSTIPINDHFIITHSRSMLVGNNAQLVSIPTNLESTSIVCDIGFDVFCSKISPSGQFDIMSPSFEKGKLLATIIGLVVLCYFLRPSVEASKLKKLWLARD